jgi:hypothetical protein
MFGITFSSSTIREILRQMAKLSDQIGTLATAVEDLKGRCTAKVTDPPIGPRLQGPGSHLPPRRPRHQGRGGHLPQSGEFRPPPQDRGPRDRSSPDGGGQPGRREGGRGPHRIGQRLHTPDTSIPRYPIRGGMFPSPPPPPHPGGRRNHPGRTMPSRIPYLNPVPPSPCPVKREQRRQDRNWYSRKPWLSLRAVKLSSSPLCEECLAKGLTVPAVDVHHLIPRKERPDLAYEMANLQALCVPCHASIENASRKNK